MRRQRDEMETTELETCAGGAECSAEKGKMDTHWRSVLEHSPDFIGTMDAEGRVTSLNRVPAGVPMEAALGCSVLNLVPPESQTAVADALHAVFQAGHAIRFDAQLRGSTNCPTLPEWVTARLVPLEHEGTVDSALFIA